MPVDAAIPLSVQVPKLEGPLQLAQQGMGLQQMAGALQLQQANLQEKRLQAQKMQEDRDADQTIQGAFRDPSNAGDDGLPDYKKVRTAIAGKVPLRHVQALDADHLANERAALQFTNDQRTALGLEHQAKGSGFAALMGLPYEQRSAALQGMIPDWQKQGYNTAPYQNFDPTDANLNTEIVKNQYAGTVLKEADIKAQEQQRRDAAARAAAQAKAADVKADREAKLEKIQDAARAHLGVTNQDQHNDWLKSLDPDIAPLFKNLTTFNPATQTAVQDIALTGEQRSRQAQSQQQRDQAAANAAALADHRAVLEANDKIRTGIMQQRLELERKKATGDRNAVFQLREMDKHDAMLKDAENQSNLAQQLQDAVGRDNGIEIVNPLTKSGTITMNAAWRTKIAEEAMKAKGRAAALQNQAAAMRASHGWAATPTGATPAGQAPDEDEEDNTPSDERPVTTDSFQRPNGQIVKQAGQGGNWVDAMTGRPASAPEPGSRKVGAPPPATGGAPTPPPTGGVQQSTPAASGTTAPPPPAAGKKATVKMRSPTGAVKDVPVDLVQHYKSLGAVVVK